MKRFIQKLLHLVELFLSLINSTQWAQNYIASFKYNHNNKWIKVD